jgi:hypothetical protein
MRPTTAPAWRESRRACRTARLPQDQAPDSHHAKSRQVAGAARRRHGRRIAPIPPARASCCRQCLAFAVLRQVRNGHGVLVPPGAGVEVLGRSRERVIRLAAFFFATVAIDRLPLSVVASIGPVEKPGQADTYRLSVVGGAVIASRTAIEPTIIEPTNFGSAETPGPMLPTLTG